MIVSDSEDLEVSSPCAGRNISLMKCVPATNSFGGLLRFLLCDLFRCRGAREEQGRDRSDDSNRLSKHHTPILLSARRLRYCAAKSSRRATISASGLTRKHT